MAADCQEALQLSTCPQTSWAGRHALPMYMTRAAPQAMRPLMKLKARHMAGSLPGQHCFTLHTSISMWQTLLVVSLLFIDG